jgi:hypothetical protein
MKEKFIDSALEMIYDYAIEADVFVEKLSMSRTEAKEDLEIDIKDEIFTGIRVQGENENKKIVEYIFFETEEGLFSCDEDHEITEISQLDAESIIDELVDRYDTSFDDDEDPFEE